jgi:ABC-type multidrug transport system ATPase subunit
LRILRAPSPGYRFSLDPREAGHRVQDQPLIELDGVTKRFGARVALDGFSLAIAPGTVVGILGPNGAGKTTVINLVSGLSRPTNGTIRWRGEPARSPFPPEIRRQIGVVTQETALHDELTVRQNLRYAADLFSVRNRDVRVAEILDLTGLSDRSRDRAGALSGGLRRRLALGRALLHDPDFLILDEPTLGVDVEARHALWGHIRRLRRNGKTVFVSTNQLDEAQALCDRIVVLREGRRMTEGDPADLLARTGRCVEIDCVDGAVAAVAERVSGLPGVFRVEQDDVGLTVHVAHGVSPQSVASAALESDEVASVRVRAPDMVEVFQALTEQAGG